MGDQNVVNSLFAQRAIDKQNRHKQTSMPRKGFEPTITSFHALDCADTAIDSEATEIPVFTVQSDRNLHKCAEPRFSVTCRDV
jgi:hypothetical protein